MSPDSARFGRADLWLLAVAIAGGALFFASLGHLWPLADVDVNVPAKRLIPRAEAFLRTRGLDVHGYSAASALRLDEFALDYVTRTFGIGAAQKLIRSGEPLYAYEISFKRRGDPDSIWVEFHPRRGVIGWGRTVQEDATGAMLAAERAREIAREAISGNAEEKGHTQRDRPARRDHVFVYETWLSRAPELRERVSVTVTGANVTAVQRQLVPPESARRAAREREAPVAALQMSSFLLLGIAGFAAVVIFLTSLQRGDVRLKRAAGWVAIIAVFFVVSQVLREFALLREWDPLWPRWVADFQTIGFSLAQGAWIAFALFVVIAAGDALDRHSGAHRGSSFWRAGQGRLLDPEVGIASARGFLVGLVCGGALVATLLLLQLTAGAWVGIQPQGFFFFAINSRMPAISTLLYFFMVAMVEETAYRFFAGTWLLSLTGRKWIAIIVPAVLYGASHTGLDFLPPAEPFWGRALALTAVGCVWGWAFLRYDALTVILSHFTADLFIFNWPRLGSGDPVLTAKAIATMCVPLIPALLLLLRRSPSAAGPQRDAISP
jgi:hypothetical protein